MLCNSLSVEHLAFFSMFASTLLQPVTRHYIYDQLLSQYRLQNARNTSESRQNRSCSGREDIEHDQLFEEVFEWFIYLELTLAMSALLTTPLLGSWSDRIGRKVAFLVPSFGAILQAAVYAVVFNFKLEFRLLFIGNFLCGIAGYTTAFNAACLAYVSDITSKSQRTSRVAVMNTAFGVGTGLAGFISIYLLEFDSHLNSIWVILALKLGIAVYVLSFLKETISRNTRRPFQCKNLFNMFGVFVLEPGNERRWRLVAYAFAFAMSEIVISGTNKFFQYYAFSWPMCFSHSKVGYLAAALSLDYVSSLAGIYALQLLPKFTNNWIILTGFLSYAGGLLMAAFAKSSLMFFLGECW